MSERVHTRTITSDSDKFPQMEADTKVRSTAAAATPEAAHHHHHHHHHHQHHHHSSVFQRQRIHRDSQLELEAANFFKLDLSQIDLLGGSANKITSIERVPQVGAMASCQRRARGCTELAGHQRRPYGRQPATFVIGGAETPVGRHYKQQAPSVASTRVIAPVTQHKRSDNMQQQASSKETSNRSCKPTNARCGANRSPMHEPAKQRRDLKSPAAAAGNSPRTHHNPQKQQQQLQQQLQAQLSNQSERLAPGGSSSTTNSLPSVSSSPSVSPSLICPHLSLDDILELRHNLASGSPHTIGLCAKCRLDPPPNVQSPLSPIFKPFRDSEQQLSGAQSAVIGSQTTTHTTGPPMKRGYSDQQQARRSNRSSSGGDKSPRDTPNKARDDSLDYFLEPRELRRLQMSPTLRNSVEFIRKNSSESGRIIRVYKNGCPYDKPLRICILRGEFATLDHLLDYINGRQLVPLGARFLFHLDGQLVYSVHELKHGSVYIVSGIRNFDYRASSVLKSQLEREMQQHNQQLLHQHRAHSTGDLLQLAGGGGGMLHERHTELDKVVKVEARRPSAASVAAASSKSQTKKPPSAQAASQPRSEAASRTAAKRTNIETTPSETSSTGSQASKSAANVLNSAREPMVSLTRAKSELSVLPAAGRSKQKKMVTFVDTGRGSSPTLSDNHGDNSNDDVRPSGLRSAVSDADITDRGMVPDELSTNEIGIQVSESIDGFLIDLPLELPARGDDANLRGGPRQRPRGMATTKKTAAVQASARSRTRTENQTANGRSNQRQANGINSKPRKQIVTITERQLSLDEMSQLKDLDAGDHHSKALPKVEIKLEPAGDRPLDSDEENASNQGSVPPNTDKHQEPDAAAADLANIGIISRDASNGSDEKKSKLVDGATMVELEDNSSQAHETDEKWEYPGGRDSNNTPTERPISQNDANEAVRAKVTTFTPSPRPTSPVGAESGGQRTTNKNSSTKQIDTKPKSIAGIRQQQQASVGGKNGVKQQADASEQSGDGSQANVIYEAQNAAASQPVTPTVSTTDQLSYYFDPVDRGVCKWDGKQLVWKSLLPSSCVSLAIHPDGRVLAAGSNDGIVYVLNQNNGLMLSYFPLTPVCINCLTYSRDGTLLAASCANGSIFILPVHERGLKYEKVSIFQSPCPVVNLQFSVDSRHILTHSSLQELILWDLPNFRYMRENVKQTADKIEWFDSTQSVCKDTPSALQGNTR